MKILEITSQHRRDLTANMRCEFCKTVENKVSGYDDRFFHDNVIPGMKCKSCGKSTKSEGGTPDATHTRYPEHQQV